LLVGQHVVSCKSLCYRCHARRCAQAVWYWHEGRLHHRQTRKCKGNSLRLFHRSLQWHSLPRTLLHDCRVNLPHIVSCFLNYGAEFGHLFIWLLVVFICLSINHIPTNLICLWVNQILYFNIDLFFLTRPNILAQKRGKQQRYDVVILTSFCQALLTLPCFY